MTPADLPMVLNLRHIAELTGRARSTIYHTWEAMERDGRLPKRLRGYTRPAFPRDQVLARLSGETQPAQPSTRARRPTSGQALAAQLMSEDQ